MVDIHHPPLHKEASQKVKISVDEILEKYDCPICMCKLLEPLIAKCGHTFCKGCITECVNRQHECPECRAKLSANDLYRNYSLETLLQRLQEERDREQQKYFQQLAGNAFDNPQPHINQDRSPIETVFTLNLRESLLSYQEYLETLLKEKEQVLKKIKINFSQQILQAKQEGALSRSEEIQIKMQQQLDEVEKKFAGAVDQLVGSYDEHMKKIMPKPKMLPIRISIQIESKPNIKIENAHVKPYENANDLFKIVEEYQTMRGDPILSWDKAKLRFKLTGPLYGPEAFQDPENSEMAEEENQSLSQQLIILDWNHPFSKFNVAAGSTITILGENIVQFNSDKPLECMTLIYDKEPAATFNYFSCKTCNTNCTILLIIQTYIQGSVKVARKAAMQGMQCYLICSIIGRHGRAVIA